MKAHKTKNLKLICSRTYLLFTPNDTIMYTIYYIIIRDRFDHDFLLYHYTITVSYIIIIEILLYSRLHAYNMLF